MWDLIVSVPDHCLSFYFDFDKFWQKINGGKWRKLNLNMEQIFTTNKHLFSAKYVKF